MKSILIISRPQFGYHTDIYKWCQYLSDSYEVKVLTFNDGKEKLSIDGVKNIYVPNAGFRFLRGLLFMLISSVQVFLCRGTVLVCYFKESIIYKKLFPKKRMILDIRTLDVSENEVERINKDNVLRKCVQEYDFVTYISEGIGKKINIPLDKSALLPLGADVVCTSDKLFTELRLLYVGTLEGRQIEKTIEGFALARKKLPSNIVISYDIVGDGKNSEREMLQNLVNTLGLQDMVSIHGYIVHEKLSCFFEKCNVGVAFVPITDYYDFQPPTKTFEYALSGLYVVATDTSANREVISPINGCLIKDSADSFAEAILDLHRMTKNTCSSQIRESMKRYEWKKIVDNHLIPILERV